MNWVCSIQNHKGINYFIKKLMNIFTFDFPDFFPLISIIVADMCECDTHLVVLLRV